MIIKNAQYIKDMKGNNTVISCTINAIPTSVPLDPANTVYQAILEWAKIDGNTIEEAD